ADRAGMDGYAVVARDTVRATKSRPVVLRRLEVLHADTIPRKRVTAGSCTEVATGSTLPAGANSVVRFEDTQREGDVVNIFTAVHAGQHVVARASDIRRGSRVVPRGTTDVREGRRPCGDRGGRRASLRATPSFDPQH